MSKAIRVRFAPAPTGYMHIGNLHTALFNWLFARSQGGAMVLRIEDTDELRSTPEVLGVIYEGLRWLGLDWEEGPDVGGPYGPYVQSERLEIYQAYVQKLLDAGRAYECFCAPEELEEQRELMRARGLPPRYDGRCCDLTEEDKQQRRDEGRDSCMRFRVKETGNTVINDIIQGEVTYDNALVGDPVIVKTSGYPTYHLAVVVDDHLMEISHVIRAVEHLPNTQIHLQLQEALDIEPPQYAHLALILGEDRTKLSKRHGAVAVTDYAEQGFLPEAMFNFLALLGWSPGSEEEILTREQIIERFSLAACSSSPSVFDLAKAEWMNGEYINRADPQCLADRVLPILQEANLMAADPSPGRRQWLVQVIELMQSRVKLLSTFTTWARYFFTDDFEYDNRAREQWLNDPQTPPKLTALADHLKALDTWSADTIEGAVRGLAEELGQSAAKVIHPCRAAVTGTTIGPSLFHLMALIDQSAVVGRLRRAADLSAAGELQPSGDEESQ